LAAILLFGCRDKNRLPHPDVSDIDFTLELKRFEDPLMQANGRNYREELDSLSHSDSAFYSLYTHQILNMQAYGDSNFLLSDTVYKYLISDAYMINLYDSIRLDFADMSSIEKELENALKYYRYYFPDLMLPSFYTYIAPFVYQVVVADEVMGIELNMFMGEHFSLYGELAANMPQYLLYRFDKRYMVVSVMRALMDGAIPDKGADANMLDDMLVEGKRMYYLDLMLPDTPDSIKIGYSSEQMAWCNANEAEIWKFFAGEDLFFSTRNQDKQRYIGESPAAFGMPEGAPGRIGIWVGWQIVRAYMQANPELTIQDLFNEMDAAKILKGSQYKP
jgi:hypothetical protein